MRTRAGTTVACAGGAVIAFDIGDDALAELIERADYAVGRPVDRPPAAEYRRTVTDDGSARFERRDDRRGPAAEVVGTSLDELVDDLHLTIAVHATDEVFIHAGVVGWNGRAIVLPGRSGVGKSTLVHALVAAGADYLSDEYARVTPDGRVAPYPRPIHLRTPTGRRLVDARGLGRIATTPLTPGLVVFTRYEASSSFRPQPVSPAPAALELLDNTVVADLEPQRASAAVASLARAARTVRSGRGDAEIAAAAILDLADAQEMP